MCCWGPCQATKQLRQTEQSTVVAWVWFMTLAAGEQCR